MDGTMFIVWAMYEIGIDILLLVDDEEFMKVNA